MTQTPIKLSFEDYLTYNDSTENRYELVDGELVLMPPATGKHEAIITLLLIRFYLDIQRLGLDWHVRPSGTGVRTRVGKSRLTDLVVMTAEQKKEIDRSSAVLQSPPLLVVEVVSPESLKRDYEQKPSEYAATQIPEYWIVDPLDNKVSILLLLDGSYQTKEFKGSDRIISPTFPELFLNVEQVLSA